MNTFIDPDSGSWITIDNGQARYATSEEIDDTIARWEREQDLDNRKRSRKRKPL